MLELKANSAEVRIKIAEETKRVTGGVGVTSNINRAREAQVRAALEAQRDKVLRMKQVRDEGLVLAREVESAQRAYDALMARSTQTGLESQTTQSNAFLLTPADPPSDASSPKVMLNTMLAALLGVFLAVGAVLVMELMDRRVRTVDDVVQALGLPVLGTMPRANAKRFVAGRHVPSLSHQRMVGLPAPLKEA